MNVVNALYVGPVDAHDEVSYFHACSCGRAVLTHRHNLNRLLSAEVMVAHQSAIEPSSLSRDAQVSPSHTPVGEELGDNETSGAGRYGKADALGSHDDRGVHTHDAPEMVWPGL